METETVYVFAMIVSLSILCFRMFWLDLFPLLSGTCFMDGSIAA